MTKRKEKCCNLELLDIATGHGPGGMPGGASPGWMVGLEVGGVAGGWRGNSYMSYKSYKRNI